MFSPVSLYVHADPSLMRLAPMVVVPALRPGSMPHSKTPDPFIERTRNGMRHRAIISFRVLRVPPLRSAYIKP
jgi:hypothetical protein